MKLTLNLVIKFDDNETISKYNQLFSMLDKISSLKNGQLKV